MKKLRQQLVRNELKSRTEPTKGKPPFTLLTTKNREINFPEKQNCQEQKQKQNALQNATQKIRFYMAGEYSEKGRPHFHACLFGHDFKDKIYFKKTTNNGKLYTSATLDKIWGKGFCSIGDVTHESAAYIARYIMGKITGPNAALAYQRINEETGEIYDLQPEYNKMSLKPGIGATWIEQYETDVFPEGEVTLREGRRTRTPKYYDRKFKKKDRINYEEMLWKREQRAKEYIQDTTPERLKVREQVAQAKLNQLLRSLE